MVYTAIRTTINVQVGLWGVWKGLFGCTFFKWVNVCRANGLWEQAGCMDTLGNRDCQLVSRRVLEDFTDDALNILAGSLFCKAES